MSETRRLLNAARDGDRSALEALYRRHEGRLLCFIQARMGADLAGRLSARDLLQETLLESARKLTAFQEQADQGPSSFYRWLVGIARFKLREARRAAGAGKRARERPLEHSLPGADTSPSGRALREERGDSLHSALERLPPRQAEAVRLRYLEGLSLAETAEQLQSTTPAVKALVGRGLQALARALGP